MSSRSEVETFALRSARDYAAAHGLNLVSAFDDTLCGDLARFEILRRLRRSYPSIRGRGARQPYRGAAHAMKDWPKERWRKLYLREAVEQRAWSVMTRGLRDYLIRVAEDDGALVRDAEDPLDALVRALGVHTGEADLVRASLRTLQRDGFLSEGSRSLFVANLPLAQAWEHRDTRAATQPPERAAPPGKAQGKSSKERVRQFRERQRLAAVERQADLDKPKGATDAATEQTTVLRVTASVTSPVAFVTSNAAGSVTDDVTGSRGSRNPRISETFLDPKTENQKDLHPQIGRASRVTPDVTSSVTGVTSPGSSAGEEKKDDPIDFSTKPERAELPSIEERAIEVQSRPALAMVAHPDRWPEVVSVARAFANASGLPEPRLGKYERDSGVRALVALYATGFTQAELEHVATLVPRQPWWTQPGKRLGLSSLTIEVVRRNLPSAGPPRPASPHVAKILAEVQRRREAG